MTTAGKKLPLWKVILFSLLPTLFLFGLLEGAAQAYFYYKETRYFESVKERGEEVLANDSINFMKQSDGHLGYRLKPNLDHKNVATNSAGFFQRDAIPLERKEGVLRIAALGESTTQGHNVDRGNYPLKLKHLIEGHGKGYDGVEMINGGVAGWISGQVARFAEAEVSSYRPDIVLLYIGWNDFQTYDPFREPPKESRFEKLYGSPIQLKQTGLKSIAIAQGLYDLVLRQVMKALPKGEKQSDQDYASSVRENYRFFIANVRQIVKSFRAANPDVKIAISTLVDRWRVMPAEVFNSKFGRIWWMSRRDISQERAADAIARFNELLREIAREEELLLIDTAKAFEGVDKNRIFTPARGISDFAHMFGDDYELMSKVFYGALLEAGYIEGEAVPQ